MNNYSDVIMLMAAITIFSVFANNTNQIFVRSSVMLTESELEYTGITLAQGIIDEARTKVFDELLVAGAGVLLGDPALLGGGPVPDVFTAPGSLGPDAGEVYPNFDDFDDFHGLNININTGYGAYNVTGEVFYVTTANPTVNAGTRTINKRLEITVTHENVPNSITLSYIKTYF